MKLMVSDHIKNVSCYLCQSTRISIRFPSVRQEENGQDMARAFLITDGEYHSHPDIYRCEDCSLVFSDPRSETAGPLDHYRVMSDPDYHCEADARVRSFHRILAMLERLGLKGSLLDIGAATGILLSAARERGWQVSGVEPSIWAVKEAKERYNLHIKPGTLQENHFTPHSFDAIVILDVIEHLTDPRSLLRDVVRIMRPGATLVITTPDIASPVARMLGPKWWHIRRAHQFYFNDKTLLALLDEVGLSVIKRRRYPWSFSLHYWISRFEHFNPPIYRCLRSFERSRLGKHVARKIVTMNFFDSFEWYCRCRPMH